MQQIILHDEPSIRAELLPLTYTRAVSRLRIGILTIAEKWQLYLRAEVTALAGVDYLDPDPESYSESIADPDTLFIAGNILPDGSLACAVESLAPGQRLVDKENVEIARRGPKADVDVVYDGEICRVKKLYDIFQKNGHAVCNDFSLLTAGAQSQPVSGTNVIIGDPSQIFIEEGAVVEGAFLNTTGGPIYIGRDAHIMEGAMLRGPLAVCEHASVNMGTKVYGDTTIGPWCKVGGEVNNVVFIGYSNKAHDGFLGNAVIGEWCNIGAGSVASNLKNDYTPIRLWNYPTRRFERTDLQFCGLIMGDHSKAGINTMFNTATVLGVGVNIHGSGFPRNFVASFQEGSTAGYNDVSMSKFFDIARRVMARRQRTLTEKDERMFYAIRQAAEELK